MLAMQLRTGGQSNRSVARKAPEAPKTYRVSAGDLDLQDIGGAFGGGLQPRYRSYAEKLKAESGQSAGKPAGRGGPRKFSGPRRNSK